MQLTDKIGLVTGAAGVMGQSVGRAMLDAGMQVVLADIVRDRLLGLSDSLGEKAVPLALDIADGEAVAEALKEVEATVGTVDVLVNCAGILSNNKSETTTPEEWRKVIDVNLNGMFYMSKAVIPGMKEKGWGRIVNVSSLAAKTGGITAGTAYSTSKGGVSSLTFSLAAELAPYGITVNGISPAYVKTPMITEQLTEEQRQAVLAKIPVGRFCEPEEFAHTVMFLVSPLSGFITGEIIDLNGGIVFD